MGDTKEGREDQAQAEDRRQRKRAIQEELERWHETEPPRELEDALEDLDYPVTTERVAESVGDYEVPVGDETIPVTEIVRRSTRDRYDSAEEARYRIRRPSVAASLRRLLAVSEEAGLADEFREREDAYEKTLRALEDVDADDEDEGIAVVTAWIVERVQEGGALPKSRRVRNHAADFCRDNDYEIRDDSWLGA
jgi:hypothetical protein